MNKLTNKIIEGKAVEMDGTIQKKWYKDEEEIGYTRYQWIMEEKEFEKYYQEEIGYQIKPEDEQYYKEQDVVHYHFYKNHTKKEGQKVAYLSYINVSEEKRSMGYGSIIMEQFEKELKTEGCEMIYLFVNDSDTKLQNWYKEKKYEKTEKTGWYKKKI